jgi:hypothetical protein
MTKPATNAVVKLLFVTSGSRSTTRQRSGDRGRKRATPVAVPGEYSPKTYVVIK